jgi:hypothetical protein
VNRRAGVIGGVLKIAAKTRWAPYAPTLSNASMASSVEPQFRQQAR